MVVKPKKMTDASKPVMPDGEEKYLNAEKLVLDPANLRLLEVASNRLVKTPAKMIAEPAVQQKVLALMTSNDKFDVNELVTSILSNGFLRHERLVVAPLDREHFIVLEGNRRLSAVRKIEGLTTAERKSYASWIIDSTKQLPCLVLKGDPVDGIEERLADFRREAEIYVGMRHLMGARQWSPAGRYEFQARLIDEEGMAVDEVARRFGRKRMEVIRDLKAHRLFKAFAKARGTPSGTPLTYNAFAEAARSKPIMTWLGWSDETSEVSDQSHQRILFDYLVSSLSQPPVPPVDSDSDDGEEERPSAERVMRELHKMLKLNDHQINEALSQGDLVNAKLLYESRKEGQLEKRLATMIRSLETVSLREVREANSSVVVLLERLVGVASELKDTIANRQGRPKKRG